MQGFDFLPFYISCLGFYPSKNSRPFSIVAMLPCKLRGGGFITNKNICLKSPSYEAGWGVSTHLKNISQIGNLPQVGVKIKDI